MSDDFDASVSTTGVAPVGIATSGEIETPFDEDWFATTLVIGRVYRFELRGSETLDGTLLDPLISPLKRADGGSISGIFSDVTPGTLNHEFLFTPYYSGVHYVPVRSNDSGTGTYILEIFDLKGNTAASELDDLIVGTESDDSLHGLAGDDSIHGIEGNDLLEGGDGNDKLFGGAGRDTLRGGDGEDSLYASSGELVTDPALADELYGDDGNDTLSAGTYASLFGGTGDDTLSRGHYLDGGPGADTMFGQSGEDVYIVDNIGDFVAEYTYDSYGPDNTATGDVDEIRSSISWALRDWIDDGFNVENLTLLGSADLSAAGNEVANVISGNSGNNVLHGGSAGNDTLLGFDGNDTLTGGIGNDELSGGDGADIFAFAPGDGNDTISDFVLGTDSFDFTSFIGPVTQIRTQNGSGDRVITVNSDVTITLTGVPFNYDPEITSAAPTEAIQDSLFTYTLTAMDLDSDDVVYDPLNSTLPGWLTHSGGLTFSGTPLHADVGLSPVTVAVSDGQGGSDSQSFNLEVWGVDDFLPGSFANVFGNVQVNVPATGNIEDEGDRDRFEVSLQAGAQYSISLEGIDTVGGSLLDPNLVGVFNSSDFIVAGSVDSNSGVGANALVANLIVAEDGIYYIEVGSANDRGTGDYTLTVDFTGFIDDFLPGIAGDFGSINVNSQATGEIEASGDVDGFNVFLQADATYRINIRGADTSDGTLTDPTLVGVFNSDDELFAGSSDDDSGVGVNAAQIFHPPLDGVYQIKVAGFGDATGTYTVAVDDLEILDDFTSEPGTTGSIAPGGNATGRIDFPQDTDWFKADLAAGRLYKIELESASGNDPLGDPVFNGVHDSNGLLLPNTENDDGGEGSNSAIIFASDQAGTYYLSAGGFEEDTGEYRLVLSDLGAVVDDDNFDITIEFPSGAPAIYIQAIEVAVSRWEEIITGDLPFALVEGFGFVDDILIEVDVVDIDLVFEGVEQEVLAISSVLDQRPGDIELGSSLPTYSRIVINSEAVETLLNLDELIMNTIGRALGFGSLWEEFGLVWGSGSEANYTGLNALREMSSLYGSANGALLLEDGANGAPAAEYWREDLFYNELMTPWVQRRPPSSGPNPDPTRPDNPISVLTIAAMEDLGYQVNYGAADPYAIPRGAVSDGYISGARLYEDNNGDGIPDPGEDTGVTTDANGNFSLIAIQGTGPILAVGGTNIDTGLPNDLVLSAPQGARVVNPITSLIQAVIYNEGGTSDDAEAKVQSALGIEAVVDLTDYDPLSQNPEDEQSVSIQSLAAQLAVLASVTLDTDTFSAITAYILGNAGQVLDLGDLTLLKAILPEVDDEVLLHASNINQVLASANSLEDISNTQGNGLDGSNDTPVVNGTIVNQLTVHSKDYDFKVPQGIFVDLDAADSLTYSATLDDDSPLPDWLSFNPTTNTFSGTPEAQDIDQVTVKVTAQDQSNESVSVEFLLTVVNDSFQIDQLNGTDGFVLNGVDGGDQSGQSVANAGDINGDGFDDFIIGARFADPNGGNSGSTYIVFGAAAGFTASVALADLDGNNGFRLDGVAADDQSGISVSSAGDVNGDGYNDLIIGAHNADPNGFGSGSSYVVFGKQNGFTAQLNLASLDGITGFRLDGEALSDSSGFSVGSAGDVNGDGFDDLIIGAPGADPNGSRSGSSYVFFGKGNGFDATFDLANLNGNDGFRLDGTAADDESGIAVSGAGDINDDGFDDLIIGANGTDFNGNSSGSSFVVFGKSSGFAATIDLSSLDGSTGFRLDGETGSLTGSSVSGAGDVNDDGYGDLIVGAPWAAPNGDRSGTSFVLFGKADGFSSTFDLADLDGNDGLRLNGESSFDYFGHSVSNAGDVNGDGYGDLLVGAYGADYKSSGSGSSYLLFGRPEGFAAALDMNNIDQTTGFRMDGLNINDETGWSVSAAGDINTDGYDDLLVGAYRANPGGPDSGASYVVFGKPLGQVVKGMLVEGGAGDDSLVGGSGNDTLVGNGGRDTLQGFAGNDQIEGGDDLDHALYQNDFIDYSISNNAGEITVSGPVSDGEDILTNTERLHFTDKSLAFDLDGSAGTVAKLLGVVLGKDNWHIEAYVGIGLDLLDNSDISFETLMDIAIDVVLGSNATNAQVVTLIYTNLIGQGPSQGELNDLVGLIENGTFTQESLGVTAANHEINLNNIDLVGLIDLGLEYLAIG